MDLGWEGLIQRQLPVDIPQYQQACSIRAKAGALDY
jgi:hypothetical protein